MFADKGRGLAYLPEITCQLSSKGPGAAFLDSGQTSCMKGGGQGPRCPCTMLSGDIMPDALVKLEPKDLASLGAGLCLGQQR